MNRVDRLLGYILSFQTNAVVRAQDLAARFEVSERTVYRDIEALCQLGVPIAGLPGEGYRLLEGYYLPPIMFNEDEARALDLALLMLMGLAKTGKTLQSANTASVKIKQILPKNIQSQLEILHKIIAFYTVSKPPIDLDDSKFIRLQQAIEQRQVVQIEYFVPTREGADSREIEPLGLVNLDNKWILNGYCRLRQDYRNFRLDRISKLTIKNEIFIMRRTADQQQHIPEAVLQVRILFDASVARLVRENQHFGFVKEVEVPTSNAVLMEYAIASVGQILGWLLTWGAGFEVLEPPELRNQILQIAEKMLKRHQSVLAGN